MRPVIHRKIITKLTFAHYSRIERFTVLSQICDAHLTNGFNLGDNFTDSRIIDVIKEGAPNFTDTMFFCKWRNEAGLCEQWFEPIFTEEGLCFTFNVLDSREMYRDT